MHLMLRVHPAEVGLKSIGTLNPSTRDMSKKSKLLNWFSAYSASVLGGWPNAEHSRTPPQSPVWHVQRPAPSKLHPVWAHTWAPVVPVGGLMVQVSPLLRGRPPPGTSCSPDGVCAVVCDIDSGGTNGGDEEEGNEKGNGGQGK
ncbi:hypothetical protein RHMOL_Rhmol07G0111200 [Rhododendron molle]|uniref:Uncharacterized protein n=1 Tax=Rhododendron molle TaxID=49168 RepID=A0ACC0MZ77_RHOML|nr:hypothetical protein RHMOL_Rhmol07G0111200 [Rhododendron molle]